MNDSKSYRIDAKNPLPGWYRARVEYNRDPLRIGRVKIRIPQLHGMPDNKDSLNTSDLPWAMPGAFLGAGDDMGQFIVPHVGTLVWVGFEEGDPLRPVYFGGILGTGAKKPMNHIGDIPKDNHPDYMGVWQTSGDLETPKEIYEGRTEKQDITRTVIYKSPKGHAIYLDETDGEECFVIVDRVGQMVKFTCPVPVNDNKGNGKRRGIKSAESGTQLNYPGSKIEVMSGSNVLEVSPDSIKINGNDLLELFEKVNDLESEVANHEIRIYSLESRL